jgi:hypothetical protein
MIKKMRIPYFRTMMAFTARALLPSRKSRRRFGEVRIVAPDVGAIFDGSRYYFLAPS